MIISIPNDAELYAQQQALDCEDKPILTLIKMMQRFYTSPPFSEDSLEIQINPSLLSDGYRANPSMFARNANLNIYTYAKGLYRNNTVILLYTNNADEGIPFIRRLKDFLQSSSPEETLTIPLDDVPESYRYKPELLRYIIKKSTSIILKTKKTKTAWIYRRQ